MNKVYIPNKSPHDFRPAEDFGSLIFLTQGMIPRFQTSSLAREIDAKMQDSSAEDHILVASLPIVVAIASSIQAQKFGRVNYLIFSKGRYVERTVDYQNLI